jgi:hypothetical protein
VTKVQIRLPLQRPLDDTVLTRLSATNSLYGIQKLLVAPTLDAVEVEYDATRLEPADVVNALSLAGVAVSTIA